MAEVGCVVEERRVDDGRQDRADVDFMLVQHLLPQGFGEAPDSEFAGGIGGGIRLGQTPDDRGVVDDHAVTLGAELAHRGLGAVDVAEQVGLDHPAPDIGRDVLETPEDADAGVVEPDVDPAEVPERLGGEVVDLILLRRVGLDGQRIAAEFQAFALHVAQHVQAAGCQNDGGSLLGESVGRRAADAAGGAGDHDDGIIGV